MFYSLEHPTPIETGCQALSALPASAHFFFAICTLTNPLQPSSFFWIPSTANLLFERERNIALLRGEVSLKTRWMEQGRAELAQRNAEFEALLHTRQALQDELETRNRWAAEQDLLLAQRGLRIQALQTEIETAYAEWATTAAAYEAQATELDRENRAKTEWALETERRLTAELEERGRQLTECAALLAQTERTVEERTLWAQSARPRTARMAGPLHHPAPQLLGTPGRPPAPAHGRPLNGPAETPPAGASPASALSVSACSRRRSTRAH